MQTTAMDLLSTPTSFPLELDWQGKMEPSSPSAHSQQSFAEEQQSNYDDIISYDYCKDIFNDAFIGLDVELKLEPIQLDEESVPLLIVGKEEKDPWYDDKLKQSSVSPPLSGYEPLPAVLEETFQPQKDKNTEELLMEFDCVYGNVGLNHLTPPQTPPQTLSFGSGAVEGNVAYPGLLTVPIQQQPQQQQQLLQFQLSCVSQTQTQPQQQLQAIQQQQIMSFPMNSTGYYIVDEYATTVQQPQQQQQQQQQLQPEHPPQQVPGLTGAEYGFCATPTFTRQQLDEVMHDLVRSVQLDEETRGQQTITDIDVIIEAEEEDDDSCGFSEQGSDDSGRCSSSVSRSPAYSDSADSSYYGSSSFRGQLDNDDEEWCPAKSKKLNVSGGGAVSKKRVSSSRPYGRGTEEKKSRKKEQNKNAATRYRQKKKAEIEEILIEESKLQERNDELKSKSADLSREVRYLKKLMRELFQARGLI
ncbi:probable basic-leucine zipper transcription factor K isoform X2 [Anopheles albimanus]|uniref:probable basic-leucine zipper transcription factor K isoform X2 n=1 Tax=Anopheles albimanus TaxID=7167 RepID=UPI001641668D|nr:probable basic-leucine zipper transcription factor K isoform X2 [Anopheles albimanus]